MTNSRNDGNGSAPTEQNGISNNMRIIIRISRTGNLKYLKKEHEKELLEIEDDRKKLGKVVAIIKAIDSELERRRKRDEEAEA